MDDRIIRMNELFQYTASTGCIIRVVNQGRMLAGDNACTSHALGYLRVHMDGISYMAHQVAFAMHYGRFAKLIDHKNEDKMDNRICNLREATWGENLSNRGPNRNNTSGYKGVSWSKSSNKWAAQLMYKRKHIHLGLFLDKHEAARVYNTALAMYRGKFAKLNKLKGE